ncbi:hypothetical protein GCM10027035_33430 [Emticicia sediminis]
MKMNLKNLSPIKITFHFKSLKNMQKSLKELYKSATIITDPSLDGKINRIERSPEHQAMQDKLVEAYQRMKTKKVQTA